MSTRAAGAPTSHRPVHRATVATISAAIWLAACLAAGAAVSWLSFAVSARFAPFLLFPLLGGGLLGLLLIAAQHPLKIQNAPLEYAGAVLAAAIAIGGQHYLSYRHVDASAEAHGLERFLAAQAFPELASRGLPSDGRPASFWQYLRQAPTRGRPFGTRLVQGNLLLAWWTADACLTLLAVTALVYWRRQQPRPGQGRIEEPI